MGGRWEERQTGLGGSNPQPTTRNPRQSYAQGIRTNVEASFRKVEEIMLAP